MLTHTHAQADTGTIIFSFEIENYRTICFIYFFVCLLLIDICTCRCMLYETRAGGRGVGGGGGGVGVGSTLWHRHRAIILIIIIIIAFQGAIRDFFFLQSPHSAANCLQHVRSSGPGATVCKSRATHRALITCKCQVTCHLVRRDSSAIKFDRVEIAFIWALFYWLNH